MPVTLTPFRPGYLALDTRGAAGHHDAGLMGQAGRVLARARLSEDAAGMARLHALIGEHAGAGDGDDEVEARVGTGGLIMACGWRPGTWYSW